MPTNSLTAVVPIETDLQSYQLPSLPSLRGEVADIAITPCATSEQHAS